MTQATRPQTISEYIDSAPAEARDKLRRLQTILDSVAPNAKITIKWGNPVYEEKRILFAFAAYKDHLNFIPTPAALQAFRSELKQYTTGRGSIKLPYDMPLPEDLLRAIAVYRYNDVRDNDAHWK